MLETGNVKCAAGVGITLPTPFEPARGCLGLRMLTPAWAFVASRIDIVETARDFDRSHPCSLNRSSIASGITYSQQHPGTIQPSRRQPELVLVLPIPEISELS
jgi:hypothetical protein